MIFTSTTLFITGHHYSFTSGIHTLSTCSHLICDFRNSSSSSLKSTKSSTSNLSKVGDVEFGDVDDLDNDLGDLQLGPVVPTSRPVQNLTDARPIILQTAINLKTVVFGTANQNFNDEWRYQSFTFCDLPNLKYGLVQKKVSPLRK